MFATSADGGTGGKRKWTVAHFAYAVVAIAFGVVCATYVIHAMHEKEVHRAYRELTPFKVRAGSIGGWPLGTQRIIAFEAGSPLGDSDAIRLLGLAETKASYDYVRLNLGNTRISDESLPILKRLDGIDVLDVTGSLVTPQGARELQEAMRRTKVIREDSKAAGKS